MFFWRAPSLAEPLASYEVTSLPGFLSSCGFTLGLALIEAWRGGRLEAAVSRLYCRSVTHSSLVSPSHKCIVRSNGDEPLHLSRLDTVILSPSHSTSRNLSHLKCTPPVKSDLASISSSAPCSLFKSTRLKAAILSKSTFLGGKPVLNFVVLSYALLSTCELSASNLVQRASSSYQSGALRLATGVVWRTLSATGLMQRTPLSYLSGAIRLFSPVDLLR